MSSFRKRYLKILHGLIAAIWKKLMRADLPLKTQRQRMEMLARKPDLYYPIFHRKLSQTFESLGGRIALCVRHPESEGQSLLYLHGGAYCLGSLQTYKAAAYLLAEKLKVDIYLLDYRQGPEDPYPAGLNDAEAAWEDLVKRSKTTPYLMGDSAGGGLAICLLNRLTADKKKKLVPLKCICLSPWLDLTCSQKTQESNAGRDIFLSRESLLQYAELYLGKTKDAAKDASPLLVRKAPPEDCEILLIAGSDEVLLDDSRVYYKEHLKDRKASRLIVVPEMQHVFLLFFPFLRESKRALLDCRNFLQ